MKIELNKEERERVGRKEVEMKEKEEDKYGGGKCQPMLRGLVVAQRRSKEGTMQFGLISEKSLKDKVQHD